MAVNYDIDYNDERFSMVEADQDTALSDLEETYGYLYDLQNIGTCKRKNPGDVYLYMSQSHQKICLDQLTSAYI